MKKFLLSTGFLVVSCLLFAQEISHRIVFNQIFDNREYFSAYAFPQTIFGARLDAGILFNIDSVHGFEAGLNYLYENGGALLALPPQINLYYTYSGAQLNMAFGAFPRHDRINMSEAFLHDTLQYYRGNVEGAYVSFAGKAGEIYTFIDWTGRVTEERRETFLVGAEAVLEVGPLFVLPSFLMYHNAKSYHPEDSIPLQDNGIFSTLIGYKWGPEDRFLKGEVSAGYLGSYNRFRPDPFSMKGGIISNIKMGMGVFGLKGVYYFGGPIDFIYGDPFYRSGNYGRLDLFVDPFRHNRIESKIGWNFHVVPGEGIHHSQQILIRATF